MGEPRNESTKSYGYFTHSGTFFGIAVGAYEESKKAGGEDGTHPMRPFTSIVFAAISLEAFVNELVEHAAHPSIPGDCPCADRLLALTTATDCRDSFATLLKLMLAHIAFTGAPYDRGAKPYQDVAILFRLRNTLVHSKPLTKIVSCASTVWDVEDPKSVRNLLQQLPDRRVLTTDEVRQRSDWTVRLVSPDTERWACQTVMEMVDSIVAAIPDEPLQKIVRVFADAFSRLMDRTGL